MGKSHFACEKNCAMFVALDQLSHNGNGSDFAAPISSGQGVAVESEEQPQFRMKDRVVVYTRKNATVHGTVQWFGRYNSPDIQEAFVAGIETVGYGCLSMYQRYFLLVPFAHLCRMFPYTLVILLMLCQKHQVLSILLMAMAKCFCWSHSSH